MNRIKFEKIKLKKLLRVVVSIVLVFIFVFGLTQIWENDKQNEKDASKLEKEFSMDLPNVDYGEEGFKDISSNHKLTLLANTHTGEIALKDNSSQKIWYSNPQDREQDTVAVMKTRSSAQIIIKFIDLMSDSEKTVDSYIGCILKKGLDYKLTEKGIKFIYRFPAQGVIVPVEYTLLEDSFEAKVVIDEIEELNQENYKIQTIGVLPFFNAGGINDQGYMFVPDGSGALINYNNNKTNCAEYSEEIYGLDNVFSNTINNEIKEQIRMPVFGSKTNDKGFLAVVTSGEAEGIINAAVSGVTTGYNQVYASINYRDVFVTTLDRHGAERKLKQYGQSNLSGTNFSIRYYPLMDNDANYSGMANCYRNYLKDVGTIKNKVDHLSTFAIEMYGAVRIEKNFLGVQRDVVTALTDYSEIYNLCEDLLNDGVSDFELLYRGWNKGGLKSAINTSVSPEKALGSKKDFKSLLNFTNQNNINLYLDSDFTNLYKNGNGLSHVSDAAKLLTQDTAQIFEYKFAANEINQELYRYLVAPYLYNELTSKFVDNISNYEISSVAETSFGGQLYSDFSKKNTYLRYKSLEESCRAVEKLSNNIENFAVLNGNIYTVAYADTVFNIPTQSSGFDLLDETIPFYSMVLRGYVNMTTESINLSMSPDASLLKAIEVGCCPKFTLINGDTSLLIGSEYNNLFNVRVDDWYEDIIEQYKRYSKLLEQIGSSEIISHSMIQKNVYETKYSNGIVVKVNYNDYAVDFEGNTVEANSFSIN